MDDTDLLFIYDPEPERVPVINNVNKKMYNRGPIMNDDERNRIRDWIHNLIINNKMQELQYDRLVYNINKTDNSDVIPLVFEIKNRLERNEKLDSFENENYINHFVTVILKNGFIQKHTDPNDVPRNLFHIRFNIFITVPKKGGTTYYDGHEIDAVEGSYVLCRSGIDQHWSDPIEDDIQRISLSFGYLLPAKKVDDLTSNASIGLYTQYYPLAMQSIGCLSIVLNNLNHIISHFDIEERGEKGSCIFTISNIFTDIQCDFIIRYINEHYSFWNERGIGYNSGNNVECTFLDLPNMVSLNVENAKDIDSFIFKVVNKLLKEFTDTCPDFKGIHDNGYTLRRIHGGTKRHVDGVHSKTGGFTKFVRALSFIAVLNDDYDGGIFNFPNQNLKFKLKKGEVVLFPPYWTHPHSVTSVGEGQARYTINTWILEKFVD
jgi:hypothetical protein